VQGRKEQQVKTIFEYIDYRLYIRDYFSERKRRNPAFSHRSLAQKLGLSTSNYILLIMQGKRNLTADLRNKMSTVFGHGRREAEYFEEMVSFAHAKTDAEKSCHFGRMIAMRRVLKMTVLQDSRYEYLSTWYNPVIRELVTHPEWDGDFETLARSVRPPLSVAQARRSVELLLQCGLITLEKGRYQQTSQVVMVEKSTVSLAVTNFHREMCRRALEVLDTTDREHRDMTGCTLHISKKTFGSIKEELAQCRERILTLAQADQDADSVYHLNLHLFPVSFPTKNTGKCAGTLPPSRKRPARKKKAQGS
jgi:uncharacterized protein (TIGR02147 family)